VTICSNAFGNAIIGVNIATAACLGQAGVELHVTGPIGGTGPVGAAGPTGGTGGRGGTGLVGNLGLKGVAGPTGGTGGAGGVGGTGSQGPVGVTGPPGGSVTGPTGGTGVPGDQGIPGPQGPTGALGATGPTGLAKPGSAFGFATGACNPPICIPPFSLLVAAGPGMVGNTNTIDPITFQNTGSSQMKLSCPSPFLILVSGGGNVLPVDVSPAQNVRGVLESSFPNPNNGAGASGPLQGLQQWILSAEVTQASLNTTVAPGTGLGTFPVVGVDPYVICRAP